MSGYHPTVKKNELSQQGLTWNEVQVGVTGEKIKWQIVVCYPIWTEERTVRDTVRV